MSAETIARLEVTLDDIEPTVLRRIEVPYAITLDRLHLALQIALGWTDSHLYEFRMGRTASWGIPDPDWPDGRDDAAKAHLADVLAASNTKTLQYLYDFGDGWTHTIKIERTFDAVSEQAYPRLVEASGACPPEDVGGSFGYADFLDVLADPAHPRRDELLEWVGGAFDPHAVDVAAIERRLGALAEHWSQPSRPRRGAAPRKVK